MAGRPRVLIYGAGAIGSLLGGRLADAGLPVTLLGRPSLAEAVRRHGLRLSAPDREITVSPSVITSVDQLDTGFDIVILTVKAYAVEAAMPDLEVLASAGAAIVSFQNGIGTEERLLQSSEIRRLVAGSLTLAIGSDEPGSIRQETDNGGIALAPVRGEVPLDTLATGFRSAGITTLLQPDYRPVKWSKLLLNLMANALPAILATTPAQVYSDSRLFRIERSAFLEALRVMRASQIRTTRLPGFNVPLLTQVMRLPAPLSRWLITPRVARGRGSKRPSLWIDVDRGTGRTEAPWLNGAVVRAGEQFGIPTPVNALLARLVDQVAGDPARRSELAGRPDLVLQQLHSAPIQS